MDPWIGPAIVAAAVSGTVSVLGWFVASWQAVRLEQRRRTEKVHDFQVALLAEIDSDITNMAVADRAGLLEQVREAYRRDPGYVPFVPRIASNVVFEMVVKEVQILPGEVIAAVIDYARLRQSLERFVDDLRAEAFAKLPPERQLTMFGDYLAMFDRLQALAEIAGEALDASLSNLGADPSIRESGAASAARAALAAGQGEP